MKAVVVRRNDAVVEGKVSEVVAVAALDDTAANGKLWVPSVLCTEVVVEVTVQCMEVVMEAEWS